MIPPRRVASPTSDGLPLPRRYLAILAVSFGTALSVLDGAIATVALPTIAHDLEVEQSAVVLVVTIYQLVLVMTLLPFSALGDRIGHRRLYQYGQAVFALASVLCFFANSLPFLLVVRAVQALGAAAALSVSSALIRSIYPAGQLGRGMGINSVVVASSAALAPTLGGFILSVAPWPWVFALACPFAIVSLLIGRHALPEPVPHDTPYDLPGALLSALALGMVVGGLESLVHGDSPVISAAVVMSGIVAGFVFVGRARGTAAPIIPIDLLSRPVFALSASGGLVAFIASMTITLSLPFRLQQDFGFSPGEVGALLMPWPLTMMVVGPVSGMLSDRFPAGILGGIGMTVATAAALLIAFLPAGAGYADIAWRMALCGIGFGLFLAPNARLMIGSAPPERAAAAGGLVATTRMLGQTLGATVVASLLALGIGGAGPGLVATGLCVVAGLSSLARLNPAIRRPRREELD